LIDLSICIVNWNTESVLRECLRSIYEQTHEISFEVIVVDNASEDGSLEMVRTFFPEVTLVANLENRGFAAANNQALLMGKGRYVFLLNPDTVVHDGALERMVRFMDRNPHAGATGCKLLNEDGTVQNSVRRFLTFRMALYNNTILGRVSCFKKLSGDYKMRGFSFSRVEEVDAAGGAALMIRRTVLDEVGLLDEGYFIFMEEMDLCRRIRARGHQIYYFPDAVITHLGGKSRRQNPKGMILIIQKSLIRYFTKFEGARRTSHFKIFYKTLFLAEIVYGLFINVLYLAKYRTVRKNAEKARRKWVKIEESIYFLGKESGSFFFRI